MSNSTRNVLIVALIFCGVVTSVLPLRSADEAEKPKVQQWEFATPRTRADLDKLGREGYQLVAVTQYSGGSEPRYHLQRPKQ